MAPERKKPQGKKVGPSKPGTARRSRPKIAGHGSSQSAATPAEDTRSKDSTVENATAEDTTVENETAENATAEDTAAGQSPSVSLRKASDNTPSRPRSRPVARVSTLRPGSAAATEPRAGSGDRHSGRRSGGGGKRPPRERRGLLATWTPVLAVTAVILGVVATILAFHPFADLDDNKAFVDREATSELTSQAQERVCAIFGYDHTDLDGWATRAQDALTGQARTEFDESLKAQREIITQTKTGADCRVDAIGVRSLGGGSDGDRASVIANLIISETQNGVATNSAAPRAQFEMIREGDQWRIDKVEPF